MRRSAFALACCVMSLGLAACGGAFKSDGGGSSGGSGGGGSGSGGGPSERKSCVVGDEIYPDGATFTDDCNSCSCSDGEVACDARACGDTCDYAGKIYEAGATFPSADGCNTCSCMTGGAVACTTRACASCQDFEAGYFAAVEAARRCDPEARGAANQCQLNLVEGIGCSCGAFVNQANSEAIAAAKQAAASYSVAGCGSDVLCGACATPEIGYCAPSGLCETLWAEGPRACKVGGVIYPHGANDVPDPTSCNQCTCENGELSCTERNCPTPCPPDRVPGTQCALCGTVDNCLIIEHACLTTCSPGSDNCAEGSCVDGVCRNLCG